MVIKEYQKQIADAQQQVSEFKPEIQRTQKMLRTTPQGANSSAMLQQARLKELERQRGVAKEKAQGEVNEAKRQFEEVMSTDAGKLQYVKEYGLEPVDEIKGRVDKGYALETFAYVYDTPYGRVIDRSPEYYARQREAENTAEELGFKNVREMEEAQAWTRAMGGTSYETPSGALINFDTGKISIPQKLAEIDKIPTTNVRSEVVLPQELRGITEQSKVRLSKDLNVSNASLGNGSIGNNSLQSGLVSGLPSGNVGEQRPTSTWSRIKSAFGMGSQKGFEETQKVNVTLGEGLGSAEVIFNQATPTFDSGTRLDTPIQDQIERQNIENARYKRNFFSEPITSIIDKSEQFNELSKGFNKLSVEEQQKRLTQMQRLGATVDEQGYIQAPTVGVGFGSNKRQVSVQGLDTPMRVIFTGASKFAYERVKDKGIPVPSVFGGTVDVKLPEKGVLKVTLGETFDNKPITPNAVSKYEPDYGNYFTVGANKIKDLFGLGGEKRIVNVGTNEQAARVAEGVVRTAPYLNPYGTFIYYGEQVSNLGYDIIKKGSFTEGFKSYYEKSPVEAAVSVILPVAQIGTKAGKFALEKQFVRVEETLTTGKGGLTNLKNAKAVNVMGESVNVIRNSEGTLVSRKFAGTGVAENVKETGSRVIVTNRLRNFFGAKPIYSGNPYGEVIVTNTVNPLTGKVVSTTQRISKEEALRARKNLIKDLIDNGMGKTEANRLIARNAPRDTIFFSNYQGKVVSNLNKGTSKVYIEGGKRVTIKPKVPVEINLGWGRKAITTSRGGKDVVERVDEVMEEFKTKLPKGKEAGDIGERTLYKGVAEETNKALQLGKQKSTFVEGASAVKTGQIPIKDKFGFVEQYKVGEGAKEVTYGKTGKVSTSISYVNVKNPDVTKKITFDFEEGIKSIKVKPQVEGSGFTTQTDEWITVSEEALPFSQSPKNVIFKKITPPGEVPSKPITSVGLEAPKVTKPVQVGTEAKNIAEETSKIIKPSELKSSITSRAVEDISLSEKSSFYGKGTYELTESQPSLLQGKMSPAQIQNPTNIQGNDNRIDLGSGVKVDSGLKIDSSFKIDTGFRANEREKINEKIDVPVSFKFDQKIDQKISSPQITTPRSRMRDKLTPKTPKVKIPIKPELSEGSSGISISKIKGLFEIIKKKRGKEIKVGEETSLSGAGTRLRKELLSGLEASGFIREKATGRKVSFGEVANILGSEFRAGKSDIFKIVQKKGGLEGGRGRLSTRAEVVGIQTAKRRKSKKLRWF